jgi:hypothetical protein
MVANSHALTTVSGASTRSLSPVVLNPVLRKPLPRVSVAGEVMPVKGPAVWPLLSLMAVAILAGLASEFTTADWPVFVVGAVPVLAIIMVWRQRKESPVPSQPVRARGRVQIVADHRPVLLRASLVLPEGRPNRLVGKVPRRLAQPAIKFEWTALPPRREPRFSARHRST